MALEYGKTAKSYLSAPVRLCLSCMSQQTLILINIVLLFAAKVKDQQVMTINCGIMQGW